MGIFKEDTGGSLIALFHCVMHIDNIHIWLPEVDTVKSVIVFFKIVFIKYVPMLWFFLSL